MIKSLYVADFNAHPIRILYYIVLTYLESWDKPPKILTTTIVVTGKGNAVVLSLLLEVKKRSPINLKIISFC